MDRLTGMEVQRLAMPAGGTLCAQVAERPRQRLLGLAGLPRPASGAALLIPRCSAVHTFGMRFRLDVLFVTLAGDTVTVHDVRRGVPPGRFVLASRPARGQPGLAALEVPAV